MNLLQVDSSPLGEASVSRQLTRRITARWLAQHPGTQVQTGELVIRMERLPEEPAEERK